MNFPISTGDVTRLLRVPEYKVTTPIRLGKLTVPYIAGRRAWNPEHVVRVALILGRDSIELRNIINGAPVKIGGVR